MNPSKSLPYISMRPPTHLEEAILKTRVARVNTQAMADAVAILMQKFDVEHAELLAALHEARQVQGHAEQQLRALALQQYQEHPEAGKQLCEGVSIREKVIVAYDVEEAFQWALGGNHLAVTPACLNREVFEDLAKRYPLPFVQKSISVQVLLGKKL